jgi:hypothetical protein
VHHPFAPGCEVKRVRGALFGLILDPHPAPPTSGDCFGAERGKVHQDACGRTWTAAGLGACVKFLDQMDRSEPMIRTDTESVAPAHAEWSETTAWGDLAEFYVTGHNDMQTTVQATSGRPVSDHVSIRVAMACSSPRASAPAIALRGVASGRVRAGMLGARSIADPTAC